MKLLVRAAVLAALLACGSPLSASGQQGAPATPPLAAPQDAPYPGAMTLHVDATDTVRGIFRVRETIPVAGGPVTLLYPQWIPGSHSASGRISQLAGLEVRANGQLIPWRRDPVNVFAFHIDAPADATALDVSFQYLSATAQNQGRVLVTREIVSVEWSALVLYPAGYYASVINVTAQLTLPEGFQFGAALDGAVTSGNVTTFGTTDVETLVDSPVYAGRHFRRVELDPGGPAPVYMTLVADRADQLQISEAQLAIHRNMVDQAYRLFGTRPYDRYEFLMYVSDRLGGLTGIEHHRSSANGTAGGYFTDWNNYAGVREVLPHELVHSWNGKYRRPADLWTADYSTPMRGSLLWVYEGMTKYYGYVLAARSGMWTREEALDAFAYQAALYANRAGRAWRPLQDTVFDSTILARGPQAWRSWQRGEDYYAEGMLIWLEADTIVRERSNGRRSLDDFARAFFTGENGAWRVSTYTFDDIVTGLSRVQPYDWATFLRERVEDIRTEPPIDGITRGGYRIAYGDVVTPFQRSTETYFGFADFMYSIGLQMGDGGAVVQVQWDSPAFRQGITVGSTVVAVDGETYSLANLRRAVTAARDGAPTMLLVRDGDQFATVELAYTGGLRNPQLERVSGVPDRLGAILAPRRN